MYKVNEKYFDTIDTEEKAYWLGFLWADGYVGIRDRPNRKLEYNIKLSLSKSDEKHLDKFKSDLDSTHPIKNYKYNSLYGEGIESRVFITNQYMGKVLSEKYGIVANRNNFSCCIPLIPENLKIHFIRGIFDGDGSMAHYFTNDRGYNAEKVTVLFTTYPEVLDFIEDYFINNNICIKNNRKRQKRHKENNRDIHCLTLNFSGAIQGRKVLDAMYKNANVFLDRKYEQYLKIKQ